jgi:hypothetical protein
MTHGRHFRCSYLLSLIDLSVVYFRCCPFFQSLMNVLSGSYQLTIWRNHFSRGIRWKSERIPLSLVIRAEENTYKSGPIRHCIRWCFNFQTSMALQLGPSEKCDMKILKTRNLLKWNVYYFNSTNNDFAIFRKKFLKPVQISNLSI